MISVARKGALLFASAFILIWFMLLPGRLAVPSSATFVDDASQYNAVAVNLVQKGMYSLDGIEPFFAREPGMSVFLAGIYSVFGIENRVAIFAIQMLLVLAASLFFASEFRKGAGDRAAGIFLLLMTLCAPVYHVIFTPVREALALGMALVLAGCVMRLVRTRDWRFAACAGIVIGLLSVTYTTFLLLPVLLVPLLLLLKVRWTHAMVMLMLAVSAIAPWGLRNKHLTGDLCLTGCNRGALQWYIRGVQTEKLTGFEPFRCLWSEYASRDWTGRSDACSFNGVMRQRWPDGFKATPEDVIAGKEGMKTILSHFPNYLWVSFTDVFELHLPYVNGWGFGYNALAALSMVLIYVGMLFSLASWKKRFVWPLLVLIAYNTAVFSLTDATPRYLLPVIFCYMALSGIGYAKLLRSWRA